MTWIVIGTIVIVGGAIAIGVLIDRKIPLLPRPKELRDSDKPKPPSYEAGEAPSTAIHARGDDQLAKLLGSRRCAACRGPMTATPDDERVRYGGHELRVVHLKCGKCGNTRSLYVRPDR